MERSNKRGQFFLLAAVIISAIIISLGITSNQVRTSSEPDEFADFTYEVKREAGAVVDYQIYSGFSNDDNLSHFVDLLASEIRDKDPDANFLFIYGNDTSMRFRNYGATSTYVNGTEVVGRGKVTISSICLQGVCQNDEIEVGDFDEALGETVLGNLTGKDSFDIDVAGETFSFAVSEHRQVIFIIQKEVENENFIAIG